MKDLKLHSGEGECRQLVETLFRTDVFRKALRQQPFLSRLMDHFCAFPRVTFVADDLAMERSNFTSWYNALALREYENPAVNDLYYLHEISHIATMPYTPESGFEAWKQKVFLNELEASVVSEAYIYFLCPELRPLSFNGEIWVDRYLSATPHPELPLIYQILMNDRARIQLRPKMEDAQEARIFDYQIHNEEWARIWRHSFSEVENHMNAFVRHCQDGDEPTRAREGLNHLRWLELQMRRGGKSYPFAIEVEAFAAFSAQGKSSDQSDQKKDLRIKTA